MELCKEQSDRLNCGCCDTIYLECERQTGHTGQHQGTFEGDCPLRNTMGIHTHEESCQYPKYKYYWSLLTVQ